MKLCKVDDLVEGDILANAVFTEDYQILLSEKMRLSASYIEKLKNLGISEVYIHDDKIRNVEAVVILKQDVEKVYREKVKEILEKHTYKNSKNKELQKLSQTAHEIIVNVLEENEVVEKIYDINERSSDLYEHCISTCTLATLISLKLNISKDIVYDIGVACLLHDLGLRYITFNYMGKKPSAFSEMEIVEYMKHPVYSYCAIQDETWISGLSKTIILNHHERMDGSGFPLKMKHMPMEAKIVAVCDSFDEMICGIWCERVKVYEAVEYLKTFRRTKYDPKVVDAFLELIAVYPVGSHILTNKGETGIVIRQNQEFPNRPAIRIIKDEKGNDLDKPKEINLIKVNNVFIEKVLK